MLMLALWTKRCTQLTFEVVMMKNEQKIYTCHPQREYRPESLICFPIIKRKNTTAFINHLEQHYMQAHLQMLGLPACLQQSMA